MAHPPIDAVATIVLDAVRSVSGRPAAAVEVELAPDASDKPAYFVSVLFEQDRDRAVAALMRTRIAQRIRDGLIAAGDAHYPFLSVFSQQDWDSRTRARSA